MVNFIICEDNKHVSSIYKNIISKVCMPYDFNYSIDCFEKYSVEFKNLIHKQSNIKIYILDLELPNKSGVDIAREIRKIDWDSIIIISTSHDELELKMLKQKLLIFDFISKFDDVEKRLSETIDIVLKKLDTKKIISFKSDKELHAVKIDDILYICKDNITNKTKLVTGNNTYLLRESLSGFVQKLNTKFYQTHRACYVNIDKIESVDFKNNIINFIEGKTIDYLSRNYKKGLKELL